MPANSHATLYVLGDKGKTVEAPENDIRGRQVKDKNGDGIGKVADLLVDDQQNKVRFLLVEHGGFLGFGETTTLIPVDAVTKIAENNIFVDQSRLHVATAPAYDPELIDSQPYQSGIYAHYGFAPFWGDGYTYPAGLGVPEYSSPGSGN